MFCFAHMFRGQMHTRRYAEGVWLCQIEEPNSVPFGICLVHLIHFMLIKFVYYIVSMECCLVYENITGYLKNHCIKYRLVCIHFDVFPILTPNMGTILNIFGILDIVNVRTVMDSNMERVTHNSFVFSWTLCLSRRYVVTCPCF